MTKNNKGILKNFCSRRRKKMYLISKWLEFLIFGTGTICSLQKNLTSMILLVSLKL